MSQVMSSVPSVRPVLHAPVAHVVSALPAGEVLGFENLVFSIFEFVHALLENSKFKSTVRKALPELIYYILLYMQITEEQVSARSRETGARLFLTIDTGRVTSCDVLGKLQHRGLAMGTWPAGPRPRPSPGMTSFSVNRDEVTT